MEQTEVFDYLLSNALAATIEAGENIMKIYNESDNYNVNLKADNTIIIEADRVSHDTLRKSLAKTRVPLMSEEGRDILFEERYGWGMYWLVDPIDGTMEFVKKNNEFSICVALMQENHPVIGVIAAPAFRQIYFAIKGRGAFRADNVDFSASGLNDLDKLIKGAQKISCDREMPSATLKIITPLFNHTAHTDEIIKELGAKYPNVESWRCGSALKFCRMAEGAAHLYFRTTKLQEWDTAAGEIIATESGLKVRTMAGEELKYNKQDLVIDTLLVSFHELGIKS